MEKQRIMLMSGFLGSGKTTSMTALAKHLENKGYKAALITNDLGSNLVDTAYVANHGVPVLEISNGCLCHDVDQLVKKIEKHKENTKPNIVIFEPVGSCVDMVEHVYRDIENRFNEEYILAPVSAIVDPIRYQNVYLEGNEGVGKGEISVAYGFKKQLEEADLLLLNKIDLLSEKSIKEIEESIAKEFPGVPIIKISALKGVNIDVWADYVMNNESQIRGLDIDMDIIMKGCEEMGWFNKKSTIKSDAIVNIKEICEEYLKKVRDEFEKEGKEILHLKTVVEADNKICKVALTGVKREIFTTGNLEEFYGIGTINVNIRALMEPNALAKVMEGNLEVTLKKNKISIKDNKLQSFLPIEEAPEPTTLI